MVCNWSTLAYIIHKYILHIYIYIIYIYQCYSVNSLENMWIQNPVRTNDICNKIIKKESQNQCISDGKDHTLMNPFYFSHTMTSSNRNIFRVTGSLGGEPTGHRWIPPQEGQWRRASMFSLIWAWTNGRESNRDVGDLRRHCTHYDVTVMNMDDSRYKSYNAFNYDLTHSEVTWI